VRTRPPKGSITVVVRELGSKGVVAMFEHGYVVGAYVCYLVISISLTVWVAKTLSKNGRAFLVESFLGNTELADSVNHLLVVGFYLINIGYVTLALKYGDKPTDLAGAIETLSTKVGLVLLVLGAMHFFNLYLFSKMRRRGLLRTQKPPVAPDGMVQPFLGYNG
jgi:Na+/melibiose symporter-like transporter